MFRTCVETFTQWLSKGKAGEAAAEHQADPIKLRHAHRAVGSNINSREHHGLDRGPDKDFHGHTRYPGLGVIAYNLHPIGKGMFTGPAPGGK
ncbi:MAG: hypothetical protein NTW21_17665 [Verrucomicrobia bacterium]|nr:hypothetical protein [Verrucomicrobiota bacterium]